MRAGALSARNVRGASHIQKLSDLVRRAVGHGNAEVIMLRVGRHRCAERVLDIARDEGGHRQRHRAVYLEYIAVAKLVGRAEFVERSGRSVKLRPIAAEMLPAPGYGPMSGFAVPRPGQYTGQPIRKLIGPYGISMPHGMASPTAAHEKHYCSWYA